MLNYEVTFIVDPVLSGDEIKSTAQIYENLLKDAGYSITHIEEMGLRQLAYPINKKYSGIYYSIEFSGETGTIVPTLELALRRDERIMRFLTVKLDKYGVKYNEDKRAGKIAKAKKIEKKSANNKGRDDRSKSSSRRSTPAPAAKAAVAKAPAPAAKAPAAAEEE